MTELDRMKALDAARTQGNWFCVTEPWLPAAVPTYVVAGSPDPHGAIPIAEPMEEENADEDEELDRCDNNAAFIAEASTFVPWAIEEIERIQKEVAIRDAIIECVEESLKDLPGELAKMGGMISAVIQITPDAMKVAMLARDTLEKTQGGDDETTTHTT